MKQDSAYPIDPKIEYQLNPDRDGYVEKRLGQFGLTKREYFAAKALQGFCAGRPGNTKELTEAAVMAADALIKELEKGNEKL